MGCSRCSAAGSPSPLCPAHAASPAHVATGSCKGRQSGARTNRCPRCVRVCTDRAGLSLAMWAGQGQGAGGAEPGHGGGSGPRACALASLPTHLQGGARVEGAPLPAQQTARLPGPPSVRRWARWPARGWRAPGRAPPRRFRTHRPPCSHSSVPAACRCLPPEHTPHRASGCLQASVKTRWKRRGYTEYWGKSLCCQLCSWRCNPG